MLGRQSALLPLALSLSFPGISPFLALPAEPGSSPWPGNAPRVTQLSQLPFPLKAGGGARREWDLQPPEDGGNVPLSKCPCQPEPDSAAGPAKRKCNAYPKIAASPEGQGSGFALWGGGVREVTPCDPSVTARSGHSSAEPRLLPSPAPAAPG